MRGEAAAAGACVVVALFFAAKAVQGYDGVATLRVVGIAAAGLLVAAAVLAVSRRAATIGGRKIEVRTAGGHGTRTAAYHEGGHVAVAKAVGAVSVSARIYPDGTGVTYLRLPRGCSVVEDVAISVAGEVAAGTPFGCGSDQRLVREALAKLPSGERAAARRAGYAKARSVCGGFWSDGGVSATAKKLLRDGKA